MQKKMENNDTLIFQKQQTANWVGIKPKLFKNGENTDIHDFFLYRKNALPCNCSAGAMQFYQLNMTII